MQSFNFQAVNYDCVASKLQMIIIGKAMGYDNIPAKLLRLAQNELTHPIANLINNTMPMSTFPNQLKWAELGPLLKKEDNLNKMNFRPVSIWLACRSFMILLSTVSFWNISLDYLII